MQLSSRYIFNILVLHHPDDRLVFQRLQSALKERQILGNAQLLHCVSYHGTFETKGEPPLLDALVRHADLLFFLCSQTALTSSLFSPSALHYFLHTRKQDASVVYPIILQTCWWQDTALKSLTALPKAALPLMNAATLNPLHLSKLMDDIEPIIQKIQQQKIKDIQLFGQQWKLAEASYNEASVDASIWPKSLTLLQKCALHWKEGYQPSKENIDSKMRICQREITFHYCAAAAIKAYKKQDYSACYAHCNKALQLRNDAKIRSMQQKVQQKIEAEQRQKALLPFLERYQQAEQFLLELSWDKALECYQKSKDFHQASFDLKIEIIDQKISLCQREIVLGEAYQEAQTCMKIQQYDPAIEALQIGLKAAFSEYVYQIEQLKKWQNNLENVQPFEDQHTHKWGYLHQVTKQIIIAPKYEAALHFSEQIAAVKKQDKWGFIDITENVVIPFEYNYVNHFEQQMAEVMQGDEFFYIDRQNNRLEVDVIELEVPLNSTAEEIDSLITKHKSS